MHNQIRSSLLLQIFIHLNKYFAWLLFVLSACLFIYKDFEFPYPSVVWDVEFSFLFAYLVVELGRLHVGSRGNRTEQAGPTVWFLLLTLPVIIFHVYYIEYQTYVLQLDRILSVIGLFFACMEFVLGIVAAIRFHRFAQV